MSSKKTPVNGLLGELQQLAEGFDRFLYFTDITEQGLSSHEPHREICSCDDALVEDDVKSHDP